MKVYVAILETSVEHSPDFEVYKGVFETFEKAETYLRENYKRMPEKPSFCYGQDIGFCINRDSLIIRETEVL